MKAWIILIATAIGLTAAASVAVPLLTDDSSSIRPGIPAPAAQPEGPPPSVEVDGDLTYKFGVMAQTTKGTHGWVFKNSGPGVLELRNLGSDCSCTVPKLGATKKGGGHSQDVLSVKPGSSEPVELTWDTRTNNGDYRKTARIGTNDPHKPLITLAIEGKVYPAVIVVPAEGAITFGTISNDEDSIQTLRIGSPDRPAMKITELVSSDPAVVNVESRPIAREQAAEYKFEAGYEVVLRVKAGSKLGSFSETVMIGTDHPLKPTINMKVLGRITGPITLTPDKVVLRDVPSSTGDSEDITIYARGRSGVKFTVAKKPEGVDVAFEPLSVREGIQGTRVRMTVKVLPGAPSGVIAEDIVLKTDHPSAAEVRVPLDILVQASN